MKEPVGGSLNFLNGGATRCKRGTCCSMGAEQRRTAATVEHGAPSRDLPVTHELSDVALAKVSLGSLRAHCDPERRPGEMPKEPAVARRESRRLDPFRNVVVNPGDQLHAFKPL